MQHFFNRIIFIYEYNILLVWRHGWLSLCQTKQTYSYDHMDRLLNVTHQTGTQEVVTITQNAYNEVGQLLNKKIHQSTSHPNALQKLDYYYNIRGWLAGVNRPITTETGYDESDLFSFELHYPTVTISTALGQFNGNISETIWKTGYDESLQDYNYQYDQANRMLASIYEIQYNNGYGLTWINTKRFNESGIIYDHNGNLTQLARYFGDWNEIDYLAYKNYKGNQVGRVDDYMGPNLPVGFQDRDNGTGYDYTYDANGNMISDYNKAISSITYNFLNLPNVVTITGKGTITFTYDAAGNKLQKTTLDQTVTPNKTTNYYYAGDYVYRSAATGAPDTLEFISHPEGRLRPVRIDTTQAISITNLKYIYDYFLKDHLGSIRSVLTTEQQTDIYAATMETAAAGKENALFSNVSSTATTKPAGFSNDNSNQMVSKLNGAINITGNKRVGPSIVLKVMTGDTISISTYGWYTGAVQPAATGVSAISTELLPLLVSGVGGEGGTKGGILNTSSLNSYLTPDVATMISTDSTTYTPTRPKAFLNWMVVGEDYVAAAGSPNHVGALQMPVCNAGDTLKQMVGPANMVIRRNGWIYIYFSNESAQDVYFDNLVINQKHGPLVEQKVYYAFGMENPALSTQALKQNYHANRKKFENQEFNDDLGLNYNEFKFRDYDPQIGRFVQVDPIANNFKHNSVYAFAENRVSSAIEFEGLEAVLVTNNYDKNGKLTGSTTINNNSDSYGPLGNGTYTVNKQADGTFDEKFDPDKGNSVAGFEQKGVSQSRWIGGKDQGGYETRLEGRLVESSTENALISLGFNKTEVQRDVQVLETDDIKFKGKFATFANGTSDKYTTGWLPVYASPAHNSTFALKSDYLKNSGLTLKAYSGGINNTPNQLGLVWGSAIDHAFEFIRADLGVNTELENAKEYKREKEN
jgi:RHS repeat-associated protein